MGGFFGVVAREDALTDAFFGTDYHLHLGTAIAGMAAWDKECGLQREIHHIKKSPFRTKFEHVFEEMQGTSAFGCISDAEPQPLIIRSHHGAYAICNIGAINNADELIANYLKHSGGHFDAMTGKSRYDCTHFDIIVPIIVSDVGRIAKGSASSSPPATVTMAISGANPSTCSASLVK